MKLKDYSVQIRKNIAVLLHIIFLSLAVGGISVIYVNTQAGDGLSQIFKRGYEDSPRFEEQFQEDVDHILKYVAYRDIFETDGALDLSNQMFSVASGDGPEIIYTLEEVLRYARNQGFYLNDEFEVMHDSLIYGDASGAPDQRVIWRAYNPNATLSEPGDAYTSLLNLSKEVLDCLSEYYIVHYRMMTEPTNLYFKIFYEDDGEPLSVYTNAGDMTKEQLESLGRYCSFRGDSVLIDTILREIPQNMTAEMEKNNLYDADGYQVTVAVDTSYPADDVYARQAAEYQHLLTRLFEAVLGLIIGIIGCLATLYYLIRVSGYRTEERVEPCLHSFDTITTESCVALVAICTMFMLFLGEKIGYRLIHLLTGQAHWDFAEYMMNAVIIYGCCMVGAFSLLRRYKCRKLWENSVLHRLKEDLDSYFADHTFSRRLLCLYAAFVAAQAGGVALMAVCLKFRAYPPAMLLLAALLLALVVIDYRTFRSLFNRSHQEDRIADAISKIAGGDTAYQMDLNGLSGKEFQMGQMINRIGTGLEQALQDQVKSERLKADLITNVSHDLKTPLTSIINYVDLLKRENLPGEKAQEYLRVLDQKSQRLKNLTEDLVEASKASSGNVKLEMATLDLVEMIWQAGGEFEEKFATRNLELVSQLPETGILIEADGRRLWRVLENVYNNAFKYAMEHSRVYTELTQADGWVYFTIKNVSESPLTVQGDELTERFVRGDVSRTTEGSGLGLSIAQSLTKLQGGTFEILIDGDLFKVRIGFKLKER